VFLAEAEAETPLRAERAGRKRLRELVHASQEPGGYERWCAELAAGGEPPAQEGLATDRAGGNTANHLTQRLRQAGRGDLGARIGAVHASDPLAEACEATDGLLDAVELALGAVADRLASALAGERVVRLAPVTGEGAFAALLDVADRCAARLAMTQQPSPARRAETQGAPSLAAKPEPAPDLLALSQDLVDVETSCRLQEINAAILAGRGCPDGLRALAFEQSQLAHRLETALARLPSGLRATAGLEQPGWMASGPPGTS
jgi:hypothetical protein